MPNPFQYILAGEVTLAYTEEGQGAPVVFLHGGGPTDLRTWGAQIEPFAARHHAIAYSRRCHYPNAWMGDGSDVNSTVNSTYVHAADLAAFISALDLDRVHLAGVSYGADIALRFAVAYPDRLLTLTLAEPALFTWLVTLPGGRELFAAYANEAIPAKEVVREGDLERGAWLWIDSFMGSGAFDRLPAAVLGRIMDNIRLLAFDPTDITEATTGITRAEAAAIQTPALLLVGDESPAMFHLVQQELARRLPRARLARIARASHLLHVMNPMDFNATVLSFLAKHTGERE
jgi:pimeloyl-ACP methyl ester carboxylesterase